MTEKLYSIHQNDLPVCKKSRICSEEDTENTILEPKQNIINTTVESPQRKSKNRCMVCQKRTGLIPFVCKCGQSFCSVHKWPDHECSFDFHAVEKERLKKQLIIVKPTKLHTF